MIQQQLEIRLKHQEPTRLTSCQMQKANTYMSLAVWGMMHEIRDLGKGDAAIPRGLLDSRIGEAQAD